MILAMVESSSGRFDEAVAAFDAALSVYLPMGDQYRVERIKNNRAMAIGFARRLK
jgi:hypothetical protein